MKSILLTTTALVAFAGAAAADGHAGISFSGSTTLGFNSGEETAVAINGEDGFYWDAGVSVAMTAALDNGITANASFGFDVADESGDYLIGFNLGDYGMVATDFVLSLEAENAGLFFGATEYAAITQWSAVGDMEADNFSEADGEQVLRGDVSVAGVDASVSYLVGAYNLALNDPFLAVSNQETEQLSLGASGSFGMFSFSAAYQEESDVLPFDNGDFDPFETYGVSGSVAIAGADISLGYAHYTATGIDEWDSIGFQVAYPFGPVTATAYYVAESSKNFADPDDNMGLSVAYADGPIAVTAAVRSEGANPLELADGDVTETEWNIDGSYDVGNGLTVFAGLLNENEGNDFDYYVAGTYDLGGGAEVLVSYAGDDDEDQGDEVGAPEYLPGTTVEVSFSF